MRLPQFFTMVAAADFSGPLQMHFEYPLGGANDGKVHTPIKWLALCISSTSFGGAKTGEIWIDDLEGILNNE